MTSEAPTRPTTILLAEDAVQVRELVCRVLRKNGYNVIESMSPSHAMTIAEASMERIDLLLTDVEMPGIGGAELAEVFMRRRPAGRVLYMSGSTDDANVREDLAGVAGVAFLQKPFTSSSLVNKVRETLERIRANSNSATRSA